MQNARSLVACLGLAVLTISSAAQETISDVFADRALDFSKPGDRAKAVQRINMVERADRARAQAKARAMGIPIRQQLPDGKVTEIVGLDENDDFIIYTTHNVNAAISTAANLVNAAPYNLNGNGFIVGVWDGGGARNTHQEFTNGRTTIMDGSAFMDHATHVAGTIAAAGVSASAKGMATSARIDSYDWNSDTSEMTNRGATAPGQADKVYVSNHSYGTPTGWNGIQWTGTGTDQNAYAPLYGQYQSTARTWDQVAFNTPYYLIFKSAGNENSDNPTQGSSVIINGQVVTYDRAIHPPGDGLYRNTTTNAANGYENITTSGVSKNIMTIGAANDAVTNGLRDPAKSTLTSFSSRGPTDDGRIKPDIVANGASLTSSYSSSDTAYGASSGTSMSGPNAAGSAILLVQHFANLFNGGAMRSSTLKGLIIHTATDIGNPGPDYHYGWGLMNTKQAADLITSHQQNPQNQHITEDLLTSAAPTKTYTFQWDGISPLRATLCWTDPAGASTSVHDDRASRLVNNLDLKLIAPNGTQYYPFVMPFVGTWTVASMSANATTGVNNTDNVEQVLIQQPGQTGQWQAVVSRQGTLTNNQQNFSLVMSGTMGDGGSLFLSGITPNTGNVGTVVSADIFGAGLSVDTDIRLTRSGSPDIVGSSKQMISSNTLRCQFNLAGAAAGAWDLVATNPDTQTRTLLSAFNVLITLEQSLDTTGIDWNSSGTAPWFAQTATTKDGFDAAQSGLITHNQTSSLTTTLVGPGTLTFWWKVSSETSYDFLRFFLNGVEQTGSLARISGNVDWIQKTVSIPTGSNTVEWRYTKDGSVDSGSDAGWVDIVSYAGAASPDIAVEQPAGSDLTDGSATVNFGSVAAGDSMVRTFTVRNTGTANLTGLALSKSGTHEADYTLGPLGATTLAPGTSTTFDVTFTPAATGTRSALLQIASNDPNENPFDINLTGTGSAPGTLSINSSDGLTTAGFIGGPFTPSSIEYTLTNTGASSLNWTAAKTQNWVTLSSTGGTLAAGASTVVTVSINSTANSFAVGSYNDTVTFTNTTNELGNTTRAVFLDVLAVTFTNIFTQNFDSSFNEGSSGWTKNPTTGTTWSVVTDTALSHSASTFYSAPVPATKLTSSLTSPSIAVPANATVCRIGFHHNYNLEDQQDGGRMQLSLDGGSTWNDVGSTQVASNFISNGYNNTVNNGGNPGNRSDYHGLMTWTGNSNGYLNTVVELTNPNQYQGQNLRLRWTIATNNSTASTYWRVDSVSVQIATPPGPGTLAVTPVENFTASGPLGGPFNPSSKQYTLTNTGGYPLNWSASAQWNWLNVTPASGTLSGGASVVVTAAFNAGANTLEAGPQTNTINFTNITNGFGDAERAVSLNVVPPGTLAVTPGEGLISTGTTGGPFTPASKQYTLTNTGSSSLNWTASKTAAWFDLSVNSGTLAPGATATVTASYNTAANSLGIGKHEDVITFANTSNGLGNTTRAVELTLTAPGTLAVTGTDGLASVGDIGGPFTPSSIQYTLANNGTTSLNWTAAKTAAWIDLSASSGTLAAGASTTLTVSINSAANSLSLGTHTDTISLTNTTNGNGNTSRAVNLTVNPRSANVVLGNLLQYYDGSPKPVSVTTTPPNLAHTVTYNGSSTVPSGGGSYAVVATITEPNYIGSASGNLIIAYAVTYNGNGNTGGNAPASQDKLHDTDLTLRTNTGNLVKAGFSFAGWNTSPEGTGTDYPVGSTYTANASITLYAKWTPGANGTWLPTAAGTYDWGASGSWVGGVVPSGADRTASFTANITGSQIANLDAPRTIGNITFTDSTTSSNDLTISGANTLTLSSSTGTPVIDVTQSGRTLTISSNIAGTNGLQKNGVGSLVLSGANNTFSGGVSINAGTLQIASAANLGNSSNITFTGTSTLELPSSTLSQGLAINAGVTGTLKHYFATINIDGSLTGSGTLVVLGGGTGSTLDLRSASNPFSGDIVVYSQSNGYFAGLRMVSLADAPGSRLKLGNSSSGGIFYYGADAVAPLVLSNRQIEIGSGTGGIFQNNATNVNSTATVNTDLILSGSAGNRSFTLGGSNTGINTFSGAITDGTGYVTSLTKDNAGNWILSNANNSYTGATTIKGGTLSVSKMENYGVNSSIGKGTGGTAINFTGGVLAYTGTGNSTSRVIQVSGGNGTILNNGTGALDFTETANFNVQGSTTSARTLTLGGTNGGTISGAIQNNTGTGANLNFAKTGSGTWVLAGSNTFTGSTSISGGGTLVLDYVTNDTSKLSDTATTGTLTLGGATLTLKGGSHNETVLSTSLTANTSSSIKRDGGTSQISLGTITQNNFATLAIAGSGLATTTASTSTANGILLLGRVTVGSHFAALDGSNNLVEYAGYGNYTATSTTGGVGSITTVNQLTGGGTMAGNLTGYALRIVNNGDSNVLDLTGRTLGVANNGTILYAGGGNNIYTINGGTLTSASNGNQNFIITTHAGTTLNVNSRVTSNFANLIKAGEGTLVLQSNTQIGDANGPTRVQQGVLRLAHQNALGSVGTGTSVLSGAALELSNNIAVGAEPLTLDGYGISNSGALRNQAGTNSWAGAITIGTNGARINSDASTSLALTGGIITVLNQNATFGGAGNTSVSTTAISGAGSVIKDGAGTLTLAVSNTYTGATHVNAGTLILIGSTQATSTINVASGAILELNTASSVTAANAVVNLSGSIRVTGSTGSYSHTLITAKSITGTPTLASPVSGYELQVVGGTELRLVSTTGPGPVASFAISSIASPQTVGTPITGITITAMDASNQTATSFTGTVTFGGTAGITGTSASFSSGVLSGLTVTPTVAGSSLTFTVNNGQGQIGSVSFNVQTRFQQWASTNSLTGGNAAPDADPDGDGLTNLQEFAFATNPAGGRPGPIQIDANGKVTSTGLPDIRNFAAPGAAADFRAVFPRRKDYQAAGITYTVLFTADLSRWTASNDGLQVLSTESTGDVDAVSVPFPSSVPVTTGDPQPPKFFRVVVATTP